MSFSLTCSEKRFIVLFLGLASVGIAATLWQDRHRTVVSPALSGYVEDTDVAAVAEKQTSGETSKVDINTASAEELAVLPGIGPMLAERIVSYRKENGPFQRVEELLNVNRIGPKTLQRLENMIYCSSGNEERGTE